MGAAKFAATGALILLALKSFGAKSIARITCDECVKKLGE